MNPIGGYHLIDSIIKHLQCPDFINCHKTSPEDFTRLSPLNFTKVFGLILESNNAYDHRLKKLFDKDNNKPHQIPTKSAFCQARKKLSPSAFISS